MYFPKITLFKVDNYHYFQTLNFFFQSSTVWCIFVCLSFCDEIIQWKRKETSTEKRKNNLYSYFSPVFNNGLFDFFVLFYFCIVSLVHHTYILIMNVGITCCLSSLSLSVFRMTNYFITLFQWHRHPNQIGVWIDSTRLVYYFGAETHRVLNSDAMSRCSNSCASLMNWNSWCHVTTLLIITRIHLWWLRHVCLPSPWQFFFRGFLWARRVSLNDCRDIYFLLNDAVAVILIR